MRLKARVDLKHPPGPLVCQPEATGTQGPGPKLLEQPERHILTVPATTFSRISVDVFQSNPSKQLERTQTTRG